MADGGWKPVPGFEEGYEINENGEVRSIDRIAYGPKLKKAVKGRKLKAFWNGRFFVYDFCRNGIHYKKTMESLLHEVFGNHPNHDELPIPGITDIAYAAGIIDGEGSIHVKMDSKYTKIGVQVGMVDPQVVDFLAEKFGGRVVIRNRKGLNQKPVYTWALWCRKAAGFLALIHPYLRIKGDRAKDAILLANMARQPGGQNKFISDEELAVRKKIATRIKMANFRGNGRLASYAEEFEAKR